LFEEELKRIYNQREKKFSAQRRILKEKITKLNNKKEKVIELG